MTPSANTPADHTSAPPAEPAINIKKLTSALAAATRGPYRGGLQRHSHLRTHSAKDVRRRWATHPPVSAPAGASARRHDLSSADVGAAAKGAQLKTRRRR